MIRSRELLALTVAVPLLAACVIAKNPSYPPEWAASDVQRIGSCPAIAGVYAGMGLMALDSGVDCFTPRTAKTGEWHCGLDLAANLGLPDGRGSSVELRQPNGETLEVILHSSNGASTAVLKKGKDFSCDAESLYFSGTENVFGSKFMTAVAAPLLTGGVSNHTRAFVRTEDGQLTMTVRGRMVFFYLGLPTVISGTSHVRWVAPRAAEHTK